MFWLLWNGDLTIIDIGVTAIDTVECRKSPTHFILNNNQVWRESLTRNVGVKCQSILTGYW